MEMIHIMTRHPKTVHPDDTIAKAKEMMDAAGFRRLPVVKDGEVVGMLTERDLRAHDGYLESSKVNAAMSAPVISVDPNSTVQEATRLMLRHKVGGLDSPRGRPLWGSHKGRDRMKKHVEGVNASRR
jgi:acetoin utilization protein AcuB